MLASLWCACNCVNYVILPRPCQVKRTSAKALFDIKKTSPKDENLSDEVAKSRKYGNQLLVISKQQVSLFQKFEWPSKLASSIETRTGVFTTNTGQPHQTPNKIPFTFHLQSCLFVHVGKGKVKGWKKRFPEGGSEMTLFTPEL